MNADGSLYCDGFHPLIDMHAEAGSAALLVGGSAGEVALLSLDERREIIRRITAYARGKIRVFYGATCATTADTLELTRHAEDQGADGVVLTVPAYSLPTQTAILDFLVTVAQSTGISVATYNNPSRAGRNINPETIAALHREAPNFVADKEATNDTSQIVNVLDLTGHALPVLACDNPAYSLFATAVGLGNGTANITGNFEPARMADISRPLDAQTDLAKWKDEYFHLLPLMKACYWLPNPVVIKAGLELMGFTVGAPRKPLQELSGERHRQLETLLRQHSLIGKR
jgi:4-hydroxy-tetrahydrodipicolinate synthase